MPTIPNIRTSVENKDILVLDTHAKNGTFEKDAKGRLIAYAGGFSVVFPYRTAHGEKWAFRCWHSDIKNSKKRYETISDSIKKANLSFLCEFQYIDKGINVEGNIYPTTRMKWIDGITIKDYICQNRNSKGLLIALADNFLKMTQALHAQSLAHGDLQHGNILVDKNHQLYLVDYDSFYCPQLKGEADTVTGLADYQHPSRKNNKYVSEKLDYFSELIIYLSILAIAENPFLIDKYKVADADRLLFSKKDYADIRKSSIYGEIYSLGSDFRNLLTVLEEYLGHSNIDDLVPFGTCLLHQKVPFTASTTKAVRNYTRTKTTVDVLKEKLKKKYSENAYSTFIRYHYDLLDSADKGNITSMYQVAEWFWKHGKTDDKLDYLMIAIVWYRKAARDGHREAQFKLASCYEEGIGIQKRKEEAIKWYKEASKDGDEKSLRKYLVLKYDEDAYRQAINYNTSLLANADKGNLKSQYELGEWFRYRSKTQYKKEALVWYTKAANNGHSKSMFALAECLEYGYFSPVNKTAALHWYIKAANSGHKGARLRLIRAYMDGGGIVNKNIEEALSWYRVVGEGINASDFCNIGYAYDTGNGVIMNKSEALKYYRIAADMGDATAQYNIGVRYENGIGVTQDINIAIHWYEKAASQGYKQAQECLDRIECNKKKNNNKLLYFFFVCLLASAVVGFFIYKNEMKKREIINNIISKMVYIEGGTFKMGKDNENTKNNVDNLPVYSPAHDVMLSSYYISKYEVTREEWECVMGYNPSLHHNIDAQCPIEGITWEEAKQFTERLSSLTGIAFRLPTEAEWEYAARGGNKSVGYLYSGSNNYADVAWCEQNSKEDEIHKVGLKGPNELGLFDMSGNVTEYCEDYFYEYGTLPYKDPVCSTYDPQLELIAIICRGGNVNEEAKECCVYDRDTRWTNAGEYQVTRVGLRIACSKIY